MPIEQHAGFLVRAVEVFFYLRDMRHWYLLTLVFCTLGTFAQTERERREVDQWQEKAEQARRLREFDRAVECLSYVIALDPGRQEAYLLRAQNREQTSTWAQALSDYNIYLEWQPAHYEALWLRAMLHFRLKNWSGARSDLARLLRMPPGETTHVLFEVDPFDRRVRHMFTSSQGNTPRLYNALGMVSYEMGEHETAIAYLDSALQIDPQYAIAMANRGLLKAKLNLPDGALADLNRALELNPNLDVARHNLTVTKRENPEAEEADLTQLIDQEPVIPFPFYERARLRLDKHQYTEALADINRAIQIDSLDASYWITRGIILGKLSKWRGALANYQHAIQLNDSRADAWFHHGNAARRLADRPTALDDYSMAIYLKKDYGPAYYNRAITHYESGNAKQACADLQQAEKFGVTIDLRLKGKVCAK